MKNLQRCLYCGTVFSTGEPRCPACCACASEAFIKDVKILEEDKSAFARKDKKNFGPIIGYIIMMAIMCGIIILCSK